MPSEQRLRNIVAISADDMRHDAAADAPALAALASRSLRLDQHYSAQASCSPARTALLTSRRPDATHVWDLYSYWRDVGGEYVSLPQLFREAGFDALASRRSAQAPPPLSRNATL